MFYFLQLQQREQDGPSHLLPPNEVSASLLLARSPLALHNVFSKGTKSWERCLLGTQTLHSINCFKKSCLSFIFSCMFKTLDFLCLCSRTPWYIVFLHCKKLNFDNVLIYTWHLLHFCPSWERDPSHVALSEVSTFFLPVKRFFFSSFSLLLLRVKGRGCHTLLKPYETNCGLWIWAIQIKFDWLIDSS